LNNQRLPGSRPIELRNNLALALGLRYTLQPPWFTGFEMTDILQFTLALARTAGELIV